MLYLDNFRIRYIEEDDLDFVREVRSNRETKEYLGTFELLSKERQKNWFDKLIVDNTRMYLIFEKKQNNKWIKIGFIRLTGIDYINRSIIVGGDIAPEHRGQKLSYEMYRLIFNLGFNQLNMNRLWLYVLETNERALHIYKKIGFIEEGKQRQAVYKDGKYLDYIMMSILKEDYLIRKEVGV